MLPLTNDDRRELLRRARLAIIESVERDRVPDLPTLHGNLAECAGVFVTLRRNNRLMGCVGHIESDEALGELVARCAISSALHDSRFRPVKPEEISELKIEISVLSPPKRIVPEAVEIGQHGLIVARGGARGLLLPQVASERNWSRERFLDETCLKAGLLASAWREQGTEIYAFTADVFSEEEGSESPAVQ